MIFSHKAKSGIIACLCAGFAALALVLAASGCSSSSSSGGTKTYTVTFNANAGDGEYTGEMQKQTVKKGEPLTLAENAFKREGYIFKGWNTVASPTDENPGVAYSDCQRFMPTGNLVLYAQWEEIVAGASIVTFKLKDGTTIDTQQVLEGAVAPEPEIPVKEGAEFAGWFTMNEGGTALSSVPFDFTAIITENITLYANWKYSVTFNANAETVTGEMAVQYFIEDVEAALTENAFERDGFIFKGWNASQDGSGTSYDDKAALSLTANLVLYAQWEEIAAGSVTYVVKHMQQAVAGDDYLEVTTEKKIGVAGELTAAAPKEYTGFTALAVAQETIAEDGSTVVEVKYDRIIINLTINLDEGFTTTALTDGKLTGRYGAPVVVVSPVKDGFTFEGWNTKGGTLPETFLEDGTYTAVYEEIPAGQTTYTVKHLKQNVDGEGYTEEESDREIKNGEVGSLTLASAKTYEGFTSVAFEQAVIADGGATTVEIKYNRIPVSLTVNLNGGLIEFAIPDGKLTCLYGGTVYVETPIKFDAEFEGWYKDAAFTNTFNVDAPLIKDADIYARYKYTVTFESNGGALLDSVVVKDGESFSAPVPVKTDASFAGWYSDAEFTAPFAADTVTKNTVLYARWGYTVTFNANTPSDGTVSGTMEVQNIAAGVSQHLNEAAFICEGYIFNGWNTAEDGSGTTYADKESISVSENIVLYAQWIKAQAGFFPVTFNMNGGNAIDVQQVEDGGCATEPSNPTKANASFEGWYADAAFTSPFSFATPITQVTTIYARWQYTVTFNTNGGSEVSAAIVKDGETLSEPSAPSKTGTAFDAWYLSVSAAEAVTFPMTVNADTTLYARYNCTLTFNTNGGSSIDPVTVTEGGSVTLPAAEKAGVTFAGWYVDSGFTTPFTASTIAVNTTVYARYKCTITFDANGGSGTMTAQEFYTDSTGGTLSTCAFTRDGYTFLGWGTSNASDADVTWNDGAAVSFTANTTLYAVWAFKFTFVTVDNSDLTVDVLKGEVIRLTAKSGYTDYKWTVNGKDAVNVISGASLNEDGSRLTFSAASVTGLIDRITVSALNENGRKYMTSFEIVTE